MQILFAFRLLTFACPLAVILVTPVKAPLTFPVPSKLCPQIVREVASLVDEATLDVKKADSSIVMDVAELYVD